MFSILIEKRVGVEKMCINTCQNDNFRSHSCRKIVLSTLVLRYTSVKLIFTYFLLITIRFVHLIETTMSSLLINSLSFSNILFFGP
jgi:hypothetical protein